MAHRRVENRALQRLAFRLVVLWELAATVALWVAFGFLVAALLGAADTGFARAVGMAAALMFTATWAEFLISGNWFCHEAAQNTLYQMTL